MGRKNKAENTGQGDEMHEDYNINADDSISGSEHFNEPVDDNAEIDKYKKEAEDAKDKYVRLAAEFDNFRKRTLKERTELSQIAGKDIITSLLEVLDDAERAEKQMADSDNIDALKQGVNLVFSKLRSTLQSKGLKAMDAIGKNFDPELHDAITEIPAPTDDLQGKVLDEISKGYYLNDKIIRHAKTVVGK